MARTVGSTCVHCGAAVVVGPVIHNGAPAPDGYLHAITAGTPKTCSEGRTHMLMLVDLTNPEEVEAWLASP